MSFTINRNVYFQIQNPMSEANKLTKKTENNNTKQSKNIMAGSPLRQPCWVENQLSKGQSTGAMQERFLNT